MRLLLASFVKALAGRNRAVPKMARDLPSRYAEGERAFDARVKDHFPIGSEEAKLIVEVERQGFSLVTNEHGSFATFSDNKFLVQSVWHIGWKANDGRIEDIWGIYGGRGP